METSAVKNLIWGEFISAQEEANSPPSVWQEPIGRAPTGQGLWPESAHCPAAWWLETWVKVRTVCLDKDGLWRRAHTWPAHPDLEAGQRELPSGH